MTARGSACPERIPGRRTSAQSCFWMLTVLLCLCAAGSGAVVCRAAGVPGSIIDLQSPCCLVVEKATQQLMVYSRRSPHVGLDQTYQCSTGQKQGDKTSRGDRKTPEGVYFFRKHYRDEHLEPRYGAMAFVLDFPNFLDNREHKGGNGIWLHGIDRKLLPFDSKGCIALNNADITALSDSIALYDTPIVIEERIAEVEPVQIEEVRRTVDDFMLQWESAWERKDLEAYCACYDPQQFNPGKFAQWKRYKGDLNRRYKFIDIQVRRRNVFRHDGTIIVSFLQDYESDRFRSTGFKKLYLHADETGGLAILGETWTGRDLSDAPVSPERAVTRLLNDWITAWEQMRIDAYMQCYSRDFTSPHMDWWQWRAYKQKINDSTGSIAVSVISPQITVRETDAEVVFTQHYVSDSYTDYGRKRLRLRLEAGQWKIVSEVWEPL